MWPLRIHLWACAYRSPVGGRVILGRAVPGFRGGDPMTHSDPNRLPTTVMPRHYDLHLSPDLASDRFRGSASITVEVLEPVEQFVLHALDLDITEATLEAGTGGPARAMT